MLIYFSEVLPKKYINEVMHFRPIIISLSPKGRLRSDTSRIINTEQKDEQWQEDNVKILESSFNGIIDQIYDDLFIDRMYGKNHKSKINKEQFLECIGGSVSLFGSMGNINMMGAVGGDKKVKKKEELDPDAEMWQEI